MERAFEGFEGAEGDFQRPEFQDAAHPRSVSMSPVKLWYLLDNVKCFHGHFTHYAPINVKPQGGGGAGRPRGI